METMLPEISNQKIDKSKTSKPKNTMKKLDPTAAKLLAQLKEKANKKDHGRKVLEIEILGLALSLVKEEHLKELQAKTLSEKDRLAIAHDEYQRTVGKISLDQFIGKLLAGYQTKKN
jgi:hypothetical protein